MDATGCSVLNSVCLDKPDDATHDDPPLVSLSSESSGAMVDPPTCLPPHCDPGRASNKHIVNKSNGISPTFPPFYIQFPKKKDQHKLYRINLTTTISPTLVPHTPLLVPQLIPP